MVHIMVGRVVASDELKRVPWESVATVIIDSLDGGYGEEPHRLSVGHARNQKPNTGTSSIQEESLYWMIIERTESVRNVKAVVARVEGHCDKMLVQYGS